MMIVGTVQQEDSCSWQDASRSWLEQDEEEEVGVYQVGTCQGAGGALLGTGEGATVCPPMGEQEDAKVVEDSWWAPGPEDLLIEGEEGEYFLELLMREAPLEEPNPASSKMNQPAGKGEGSKGKAASAKGKGKKKDKKKAPRGGSEATTQPEEKEAGAQKEGGRVADQYGKQTRSMPPDPLINPEAKGRGLAGRGQPETRPGARLTTTPRGECSGQEKPDS
jgi:hypothetical protein